MPWQFLGVLGIAMIVSGFLGGGLVVAGVLKVPRVKSTAGVSALVAGGVLVLGMAYVTWTERGSDTSQDGAIDRVMEAIDQAVDDDASPPQDDDTDEFDETGIEQNPEAELQPLEGARSQQLTATGSGWQPGERIEIIVHMTVVERTEADANGDFTATFTIPDNVHCFDDYCTVSIEGSQTQRGGERFQYVLTETDDRDEEPEWDSTPEFDEFPEAELQPLEGARSQQLTATGSGWQPGERIEIIVHMTVVERTEADANGDFTVTFTIPDNAHCFDDYCSVRIDGTQGVGGESFQYMLSGQ